MRHSARAVALATSSRIILSTQRAVLKEAMFSAMRKLGESGAPAA